MAIKARAVIIFLPGIFLLSSFYIPGKLGFEDMS
jgi:hypothetical protein